jgi:hypothetical protein
VLGVDSLQIGGESVTHISKEMAMSRMNSRTTAVALMMCTVVVGVVANDGLREMGVSAADARRGLIRAIGSGSVDYSMAAPAFKAASGPVRAQLASGAVAWAKAHTRSAEFKTAYAEMRNGRKPPAPAFDGTPEDEFRRQFDAQVKATEASRAAMESLPPESRRETESEIRQALAAIAQLDTPEMRDRQIAGVRMERNQHVATHTEALRQWETEFPEDASPVLARRLKAFLEISADVDYAARLELRNGKMRFVDEAYEVRSREWKLCYRAGKEAVDAARSAAAAWMQEMGGGEGR